MHNRSIAIVLAAVATGSFAEERERLRAEPFVFVGRPGDCGAAPGSNIVTSAWLPGTGLPDDGQTMNTTLLDTLSPNGAASKRDPHYGLLLNKNGPTADCSSAGAFIRGARGLPVGGLPAAAFVLGFDYRNGTHCGAGSPRFDVQSRLGSNTTSHFVGGCANGVPNLAPQDPLEWTRVRFANAAASAFPPIAPGSTIESITLIVDEGTDAVSVEDLRGVGLSVVDNIFVNGDTITSGRGIAPSNGGEGDQEN